MKPLLVLVTVGTFVVAEALRSSDPWRATIASMVGWASFVTLVLAWLWKDCGVRGGLRRLARVTLLTAVAFGVIWAYYRRAHLLDAGMEVDASFTFMGLGYFLTLESPITWAGRTTSFPQFPMQILGHLPGYLLGFDRIGPVAIHLGMMLQIAALFAVLTTWAVEGSLLVEAVTVAGVAAVFATRLTLLVINLTGYGVPAVSIGIIFLAIVFRPRSQEVLYRRVGGLLLLAAMHHYPGVFFAMPLVFVWIVAAPQPGWRLADFLRANLPLVTGALMGLVCVTMNPSLLMSRIYAVTTPNVALDELRQKVIGNWGFVRGAFPAVFVQIFFRESPGSWHLLDIAPLGGWVPHVIVANWLVSAVALGRRGLAYVGHLVALAACLLLLTLLQHLVTGFESYRDMTLILGLVTPGIAFVLAAPRARPAGRALLVGWAIAVAAYGWADVPAMAGRHYGVLEYAPRMQAGMEALRRFWRRDGEHRLDGAVVGVVDIGHFPLGPLYVEAARAHGIEIRFLDAEKFCADPNAVVRELLGSTCAVAGVAVPRAMCGGHWRARLGWPKVRASDMMLEVYAPGCGREPGAARSVDLAEAGPTG